MTAANLRHPNHALVPERDRHIHCNHCPQIEPDEFTNAVFGTGTKKVVHVVLVLVVVGFFQHHCWMNGNFCLLRFVEILSESQHFCLICWNHRLRESNGMEEAVQALPCSDGWERRLSSIGSDDRSRSRRRAKAGSRISTSMYAVYS